MKKKRRLILCIAIVFVTIFVLFVSRIPKDYEVSYEVDDMVIEERYDKKTGYFRFSIELDGEKYDYAVAGKYTKKKRHIVEVKVQTFDEAKCVLPVGRDIEIYPVCKDENGYFDYGLLSEQDADFYEQKKLKRSNVEYEGIELVSGLENDYYVWNYKGYYRIGQNAKDEIDFLESESYYNNLAYSTEEFLLTPNYDENYEFTEFEVLDMKKGRVSLWKLDIVLSYNSYYLGSKDGIVYMVDRKNKSEYALNPKKKNVERVDKDGMGKVFDEEWIEVSMTKLASEDYFFDTGESLEYVLEDGTLFLKVRSAKETMKVSEKTIDKVVANKDGEVFYLVGEELYSYSPYYGENLVLKYSEFNFNNVNSIFIY